MENIDVFNYCKSVMMQLGLIAIFKNEAAILDEWIQHYLAEGVDHFFLIDNGSTDGYQTTLQPYCSQGRITLSVNHQRYRQREHYNEHYLGAGKNCDWVLICDLDEFVYSRSGFNTITEYLATLDEDIAQIQVPWKIFGSNDLLMQPDSVRKSFTQRRNYTDPLSTCCKALVKGRRLHKIDLHQSHTSGGTLITSDGNIVNQSNHQLISEEILDNSALHLNHYVVQSRQWFMDIKATRGAANWRNQNNLRDETYFKNYDFNDRSDSELADKATTTHANL